MYINLITIDLCPGQGGGGVKPSGTLEILDNGVYDVYSYASASVDVHPSSSLSETYTSNGSYNITGEFNGGMVTVNVHPSVSLSETYISNGNYNITGEFNGGVITVDVPSPQFVTETLNVSANGTYTPGQGVDGYSQVVVDVPQSVTGFTEKNLTEGTIEIINLNNSASFVASGAFQNDKTIKTVNLPYATSVGTSAFYSCTSLTQISLPICSYIGGNAFKDCHSLTQVNLPVCSYISGNAFRSCASLTQVSLPVCEYIGEDAFHYCSSLSQVDLPMCSYIGGNAFRSCASLTQVSLPVCEYIANGTFVGGLGNISGTFCNCSLLTQVDLPMCSYIGTRAFYSCNSLSIITIGYSSVCSLGGTNTFFNTQITSSTGSIYVPASLVDAYKSAENWSYFSTQIFPIPE